MVQVDTPPFEESLDFLIARILAVDRVFALIVFERRSGNNEPRSRNDFKVIGAGLGRTLGFESFE